MKRIYLDWNVYSNLKRESFRDLKSKLEERLDEVIIPYSSAHFDDLMKSYYPGNNLFHDDIATLSRFSKDHLLTHDEKMGVIPSKCTPEKYKDQYRSKSEIIDLMDMEALFNEMDEYGTETGSLKLGSLMRSMYSLQPCGIEFTDQNRMILKRMFPNLTPTSSMWDLMKEMGPFMNKLLNDKEYYKDFRKSINDEGLKVESNSGNWNPSEVLEKIDVFLSQLGINMNYNELVQSSLEHNKTLNSFYHKFTSSYNMLDMIGYKSDKLPKETDNFQNIATDGEHAYFAMHCDLFVVGDKKLAKKARALYHEYGIKTKVVSPNDLMSNFDEIVGKIGKKTINPLEGLATIINEGNVLEYQPVTEDHPAEAFVYGLPLKYFDYFTHFVHRIYPENGGQVLTFKFAERYQSRFVFYTEVADLYDRVTEYLGFEESNLDMMKSKFVMHSEDFNGIYWQMDIGVMILGYLEGENFPVLSFLWATPPEKEEE